LKTGEGSNLPWVRIPLSPPHVAANRSAPWRFPNAHRPSHLLSRTQRDGPLTINVSSGWSLSDAVDRVVQMVALPAHRCHRIQDDLERSAITLLRELHALKKPMSQIRVRAEVACPSLAVGADSASAVLPLRL